MDIFLLKNILYENKTTDAAAMAHYMRDQFPFLGIKATKRRELTRPFFKEEKCHLKSGSSIDKKFIFSFWNEDYREFQYVAADYLKEMRSYLQSSDFFLLETLITEKSWWDSVDILFKPAGALVLKDSSLREEIKRWNRSDNIWLHRAAILHQLAYKEKTDELFLSELLVANFSIDEFFIQKAIGWALREYAKTNPQWVLAFLQKHQNELSSLAFKEASKNFPKDRRL